MDNAGSGKNTSTSRRTMLRMSLSLLCAGCLTVSALKIYLETPQAANLVSRLLTSSLHQTVHIAKLHNDGGSFTLHGISVGNPVTMPPGNLLEIDSLSIAPKWGDLLLARPRVRLLKVSGLRVDLRKNAAGVWNFSEIWKRLSGKKTSGTELVVEIFTVNNGAIYVNGQGTTGISLQLSNLSLQGQQDARLRLMFEDAARSSYELTGMIKPGKEPSCELTLAAPRISYSGLYGMLNKNIPPLIQGVTGGLKLSANLHGNQLRLTGNLDFNRVHPLFTAPCAPLNGSLRFAAGYDNASDEARLEEFTATINPLISAHATGTVSRLKNDRRFSIDIGFERLSLARLAELLPEQERLTTTIGGYLDGTTIHLAGNASRGLTEASGSLRLHDGSLEREGQLYFKGLGSSAAFTRAADGFRVTGKLFLPSPPADALLETLDAPFEITLTSRLKLIKADIPALSASSRGYTVNGRLGYAAAADDPFAVALRMSLVNVSALQPLLKKSDLRLASGSGSLSLEAGGRGLHDFTATAAIQLNNLRGMRGERNFGLQNGTVDGRLTRINAKNSIAGKALFSGITLDKKSGDGRFSYRFEDSVAVIENCRGTFDGVSLALARLATRISPKESSADGDRYPLKIELSGSQAQRGQLELHDFSGSMQGWYVSELQNSWLEGTADLFAGRFIWHGKPSITTPVVHAVFSRNDLKAAVNGISMGGKLAGDMTIYPAATDIRGTYRLGMQGMSLSQAAALVPSFGTLTFADGTLDAAISGSWSRDSGLSNTFNLSGARILLKGNGAKTILTGGGFTADGELNGDNLIIDNVLLKIGESVSLNVKGTVKKLFTPLREGQIFYSTQRTPLKEIVTQLGSMLPRFFQQATLAGYMAAEGTVDMHDGGHQLNGTVRFTNALLEVPSQEFRADGINGSLPFSLNLSGKKSVRAYDEAHYTRENYARLLNQMSNATTTGQSLRVGTVSFGPLHLGEVLLQTSAEDGAIRIASLRSSLYEGTIYGKGIVFATDSINYRADVLINGLSLKKFCATIPAIKDYISGHLDGLISLKYTGKATGGISGFTELWAREGAGEKMLVSKTFLQKLSGKQLSSFFFRSDRRYDQAEVAAILHGGYLTFEKLDISNTNLMGVRDLNVTVAPAQNRIELNHLLNAVKLAATRTKSGSEEAAPTPEMIDTEFKWEE